MLAVALAACAATVHAGIPTDAFAIGVAGNSDLKSGRLNVIDGKLTLGARPCADGKSHPTGPGCWHVTSERDGTETGKFYRLSCPAAKKFLACDPTGADPRVLLVEEPGEGTAWKLDENRSRIECERSFSLRVAAGKFAGYVLAVEEKEEEVEGKKVVVQHLVLAKESKSKLGVERLCR
jgi:hypothetical protein